MTAHIPNQSALLNPLKWSSGYFPIFANKEETESVLNWNSLNIAELSVLEWLSIMFLKYAK